MNIRQTVRAAFDHAARWSWLLHAFERRKVDGLLVLTYHRVLPLKECLVYPFPSLVMAEAAFDAQVRWLAKRCQVLTMHDALAAQRAVERLDRAVVAITFDDGYWDNYRIAAPILESHGVRGTFFISTGFVESGRAMWFDRAVSAVRALHVDVVEETLGQHGLGAPDAAPDAVVEALKGLGRDARRDAIHALESALGDRNAGFDCRPMAIDEVRELADRGHEIGSHSIQHELLPKLDDAALEHELQGSKQVLEAWLATKVRGFCYPNGDVDERVRQAVATSGYNYACTTRLGRNPPHQDPLLLRRVDITDGRTAGWRGRQDITVFRAELCGLNEVLRRGRKA